MSDAEKKKEYYKKYREEHREELKKADRERKSRKKIELKKNAPNTELKNEIQCKLENNESKTDVDYAVIEPEVVVVQAHEELSEEPIEEPSEELINDSVCQNTPPQSPETHFICAVPNYVGDVYEQESEVSSTFELQFDDIQAHLFEIDNIERQRIHNAGTACLREQHRIHNAGTACLREQQRIHNANTAHLREQQRIEQQRIHNAGTARLREQHRIEQQRIIERQHKEKMMKIFIQEQQQAEQKQIDKKKFQDSINKLLYAKQKQIQINKPNYAYDDKLYQLDKILTAPADDRLKLFRQKYNTKSHDW